MDWWRYFPFGQFGTMMPNFDPNSTTAMIPPAMRSHAPMPGAGVEEPPGAMGMGLGPFPLPPSPYARPPMMGADPSARALDAAMPPFDPPTPHRNPGLFRPPAPEAEVPTTITTHPPPPGRAVFPGRSYMPAADPPPMMGAKPGMRVDNPDFEPRVDDPSFVQPEPKSWWERNEKIVGPRGLLWGQLGQIGAGLANARPGESFLQSLNRGLAYGNEYMAEEPFRRARLEDLEARSDERKATTERRKAFGDVIKSLPQGHPLRKWGPFLPPEKLAEKMFDKPGPGMELDAETGKYRVNPEWLDAQIQMRSVSRASGETDTALMKNARFISQTMGIPIEEAVKMARAQGPGTNSVDRAAMEDYLKKNPDKGPMDYMREKAAMRQGAAKPTALIANSRYLAQTLGIPEADAAKIMSQSREQSDSSFYSTIYSRAINSPMVAGDPQRAAEIARAAVAARKQFQGQGATPGTPGQRGAPAAPPQGWRDTGRRTPDGRPIYTDGSREIAPRQ